MKIAELKTYLIKLPLKRPLKMSIATVTARELLLVRLRTDDGLEGWGEAMAIPYFTGETLEGCRYAVEEVFGPAVMGLDPRNLNLAAQRMAQAMVGNPSARCGVDVALYDLAARAYGVPLHLLLGGKLHDRVPATYHLGNMDPAEDAPEALEAVRAGFRVLKIKVGHQDYRRDVENLRQIRAAVGDDVKLRVDANQAWTAEAAIAFIRGAERHGLELIEQPVSRYDQAAMARVAAAVDVTIAPDEGVFDAEQLMPYIRHGGADAVLLKVAKAGGLYLSRRLATVAETAGVAVYPAGQPGETSLMGAAQVHFAASLAKLPYGTAIGPHYIARDVVAEPVAPRDGMFEVPDGVGLGVVPDEAAIRECLAR